VTHKVGICIVEFQVLAAGIHCQFEKFENIAISHLIPFQGKKLKPTCGVNHLRA
jgi:hypothetical protein